MTYKTAIKILRKDIKIHGANYQNLSDIISVCNSYAKDDPSEINYCLEWSNYVKEVSKRLHIKTLQDRFGELYQKAMLFESHYLFSSYLLYLEKNREESEKFYEPKMEQLNKHGLIQAMQDLENDKYDRVCISMPPGTQKASRLDSKVLTPNGFVKMKDITVGSEVIAGNGEVATVLSESPVKIGEIYEFSFDDGSKCQVSKDHLWKVQNMYDRTKGRYQIIETKDMIDHVKVGNGRNYTIDYVPKIEFQEKDFIIHPYLLGNLLSEKSSLINCIIKVDVGDEEILKKIKKIIPKKHCINQITKEYYNIINRNGDNVVKEELKRYNLYVRRGEEKHIPKDYLYASYEQRVWLLRGLLDTVAYVQSNYCEYVINSETLADDVLELVRSLGNYAKKYILEDKRYKIIIRFRKNDPSPFYVKRKATKYKPTKENPKRYIDKIEYVGEYPCKCIYISDPCHLYITDDYIITHNTTLEKFFCSWIIGKYPKDYNLFFSHNSDITEKFYRGILDITTDAQEYTWAEIFPDVKLESKNGKLQEINFGKYKPYASIQCSSIGAKNAGKVRTNRYLFCDDLIGGIEEALNPAILEKIWRIYGIDLKQRKLNQQVKEIIIMTRWSTKDVIGRIIELYGDSERTKIIAVEDIDPVTGESNFDYKYNGMSVAFFNDQALTMDEISYNCLYKQKPVEREGLLFPEEKVLRFTEDTLPKTKCKRITGQCDPKGSGTDYFVLPCLCEFEDNEGYFYCIDTICNRNTDYEMQYENASSIIVENEMNDCEFESNQGGDRVALEVNKRVEEKGWICNITSKPTETNKEARIFQCSNWILQHIYFKDRSMYTPKDEYGIMMGLLLSYSATGKNPTDDVPDVFSNFAIRMGQRKRRKKAYISSSPF